MSELKRPCLPGFQVDLMRNDVKHTDELCVSLNTLHCRRDCWHGLRLQLKTLTLHSKVLTNPGTDLSVGLKVT